MPRDSRIITKSKYLIGLQCPKYFWTHYNHPETIPDSSKSQENRFEQGDVVGELAKTLYPEGIDIPYNDFNDSIEQTKKLLSLRKPLFEAGILADKYYSRVDILQPALNGAWNIIEVKSSTGLSDVHYDDVAFQRYCLEKAGIKASRCYLMHINNQYIRNGDLDPSQLFIKEDITSQAKEYSQGIETRLEKMHKVISSKKCPVVKIGPHCNHPYECLLKESCWSFLPEDNILTLYGIKKTKAFQMINDGILDVKDIPGDFKLNLRHRIQIDSIKDNKPYIDSEKIREFLDSLEFPVYFIDFETFGNPIPPYDCTMPYRQIPFQFSLHILNTPDSKPTHHGYLADGKKDPRPEILKRLKKLLRSKGTIMAYNMSFEIGRLKECADAFAEYRDWVNSLMPRFTDLLVPFRSFSYYHPKQKGSASIKRLTPPLINKTYEGMDIADGGSASAEYVRVTFGNAKEDERKRIYDALLKYCELDTHVMIDILNALRNIL
jgi:hypothetical protein